MPSSNEAEASMRHAPSKHHYDVNTTSIRSMSVSSDAYKSKRTTFLEKIGMLNVTVIFVGSSLMIAILVFLWFLWTGNENIPMWRWLVLHAYLQRTVTLSSVALRTIIAFQSSICTSMIIAAIMEFSKGFSLFHSASLSIQRFSPSLPIFLLKGGIFGARIWYLLVITIALSTTSMTSHFISTGLIADLQIAPIIGDAVAGKTAFSLNSTKTNLIGQYEADFSTLMPPIYPTFGEYSEPSNNIDVQVDDTGPVVRAILPITSPTTRQTMSNYTGLGTLLNSRVVCVKPTIRSLLMVSGGGEIGVDPPYLTGLISLGSTVPEGITFYNNSSPNNGNNVPRPTNFAGNRYGNPNVTGGGSDGNGRTLIVGTRASSLLVENLLFDPLSYVLVNYTGQLPPGFGHLNNTKWSDVSSNTSSWATYQPPSTFSPTLKTISVSYCFTNFAAVDTNITVSSSVNRTEPVLRSQNGTNLALNSADVIRQLGADGSNSTLAARGLFNLEPSKNWSSLRPIQSEDGATVLRALDGTYGFGMLLGATFLYPSTTSWAMCTNCGKSVMNINTNTTGISTALSSIFQSSIQQTGSAARGLQAIFTVVSMMQYYDRLQQFDSSGSTSITFIELQLQPIGRTGLIIVTIGLILHLIIVIIITVVFIAGTKLSFIGESWHTLAQLQSQSVIPVLEETSLMRDSEVKDWVREKDFNHKDMVLVGDEGKVTNGCEAHVVRRRDRAHFF